MKHCSLIITLALSILITQPVLAKQTKGIVFDVQPNEIEILVRASGSKRLLELCQLLRRHMLRYRIEALYLPETGLRAIVGHRRILDCMREKDEKGIKPAIREHLEQSKREIQRYAFGEKSRD